MEPVYLNIVNCSTTDLKSLLTLDVVCQSDTVIV